MANLLHLSHWGVIGLAARVPPHRLVTAARRRWAGAPAPGDSSERTAGALHCRAAAAADDSVYTGVWRRPDDAERSAGSGSLHGWRPSVVRERGCADGVWCGRDRRTQW